MTAIFTGNGVGLARSSAMVLGSRGLLGQSSLGRANENVFVNAANGNLVITKTDEMLIGLGPDNVVSRTYNSQGNLSDDNGDNWRAGVSRRVYGLAAGGALGTAGSTVTRTDWDGSETVYKWLSGNTYRSTEGAGAYDTLTFTGSDIGVAGSYWTWQDGDSRIREVYDTPASGSYRIASSADLDGNALTFSYNGSGLVSRVTTQDGHYTDLTYSGTLLTTLVTSYRETAGGTLKTLTRVRYGYDGSNRLQTVTVDLSPGDNTVASGPTYVTTYTYDGTSKRVASISQSDGSYLAIAYTLVGADYRVSQLTQTSASGVTRVTGFSYDTSARTTTITDAAGQQTIMAYDIAGQLLSVTAPAAVAGGAAQVYSYTYNDNGDVLTVTDPSGKTVTYDDTANVVDTTGYDANGNRRQERDQAGNTITRTYGSNNELLTETRYTVADTDGAGSNAASGAMTTRFVYDSENHLRYSVSAEGYVTQYLYDVVDGVPTNGAGMVSSVIQYAGLAYNLTGIAADASIALATMDSWASALSPANKANSKRVDYTYNFRGDVATSTAFGVTTSTGAGDTTATTEITKTIYVYDQAGNLLSRVVDGRSGTETYVYDGLNRITSSSDYSGLSTSVTYNDSASTTVVTVGGVTRTSTYNLAGELISYAESASGVATSTTSYRYDALGRLRGITDPTGVKSYFLYDRVGRKVAEVDGDGSLTEFGYNADNEVIWSTRYKTQLTSTQLTDLNGIDDASDVSLAHPDIIANFRPTANAADAWEWRVYDNAHRLIQTINAAGGVTAFEYDGASRLVRTTAYATTVTVSGLITTPPTSAVTITTNAADRVARTFYDNDGRLVGTLDGEGYLTKIFYDAAGQRVETIGYATITVSGDRANGDLATLVNGVDGPPANANDIHVWSVYDNRGLLRATVDGEGNVVRYHYTAMGHLDQEIRGQKLSPSELAAYLAGPRPTVSTLPGAAGGTVLETTAWTRDNYGRVLTEVRTLASGTETDTYAYDSAGRLSSITTASGTSAARTKTFRYDGRGRLIGELTGNGSVVLTPPAGATCDQALAGTTGANTLTGGAGRDLLQGLAGNDTLTGGAGDDRLEGGDGIDILNGGDGDDIIVGGTGNDSSLTGGAGRDIFTFVSGDGADTILDFQVGVDMIDLTALGGYVSITASGSDSVITLSGGGTVTVKNVAPSALTAGHFLTSTTDVYTAFGKTYAYDDADRLISMTQPNGSGAGGVKTLYYYTPDGQLAYQINALGEVVEHRYDALGRQTDVVAYGTRLSAGTMSGMTGGLVNSTVTSAVTAIANSAIDSRVQTAYTVTSAVSSIIDAEGATTSFAYNGFNEVSARTDPLSSGVTRQTDFVYDRRGLTTSTILDAAGLNITTAAAYDAFGRAVNTTDGDGKIRYTTYDRAGRVLTTKDPLNGTTTYEYDGRGAVVKIKDRLTKETTFAYTPFGRETTMTTPEGIVTKTTTNAHGQTISIVEAFGTTSARTTQFAYDLDGNLRTTTDAAGNAVQNNYDAAGRLSFVIDARGVKTSFTYDAVNRVLSRKVDDGGLNLETRFAYDPLGRQTTVTEAYGTSAVRVTEVSFDRNGRTTTVVVNPGALALTTKYEYDQAGRQTTVTEAFGDAAARVTLNTYDKADRLITSQVDPSGLNLTTQYAYDKRGNVVARTDAASKITRFVYDDDNRLIWTVDGVGAITKTTYDAEGRVTVVNRRATVVPTATFAGWPLVITASNIPGTTTTRDETTAYAYDGDGRMRFQVNALGQPVEYIYDKLGNVVSRIDYDGVIAPADWLLGTIQGAISTAGLAAAAGTRTTRSVYDALGRQAFSIDAMGGVVAYSYDAAGNVTKTRQYETKYEATPFALSDLQGWSTGLTDPLLTDDDRITRTFYDAAGRAVFTAVLSNDAGKSFVTRLEYDAAGNVLKQIRYATTSLVDDTTTTAALVSTFATLPGTAAVTQYAYDVAGRVTDITDAMGTVTHLTLDEMGRVTDTTVAYGTAAATTTHRVFDAAGRMTSETRAFGATEASTTGYAYDAMGRVLVVTNARGYTTTRTYNAVGLVLTEVVQLTASASATTTNVYDAFGNVVKVTDARNNAGYFYYDRLNRVTRQVDPENYVTDTTYSLGGQVASVTRFYNKATTGLGSLTAPPTTPVTHANDATTTITRDKLDRITRNTDAEGYYEQYTLNAFGDRIAVRNKLDGTTTYTFDKRGLMTSEVLPVTSYLQNGTVQATTVTNSFEYDARGNRTKTTEAVGLAEQRVTDFVYDKLDRLTQEIGASTLVLDSGLLTTSSVRPTQTITYDVRGNIVESVDPIGARTLYYYDLAGRKTAEISALGTYSVYAYDAADNVVSVKVYGDAVTLPGSAGGTPPAPVSSTNFRETTYIYDYNNRRTTTTIAGLRIGSWATTTYTSTASINVVTSVAYDAMGNVTTETDGRTNKVFHFYDKRGKEIAKVDQEKYLTFFTLDSEGNVLTEERFTTAITASVVATSNPTTLRSGVVGGAGDRTTNFTYDRNGRRTSETRLGVVSASVNSSGVMTTATADAVISYAYDGLGNVVRKTEATLEYTDFAYDKLGRQTTATTSAFSVYDDAVNQQSRQAQTYYDGVGNVVRTREGKTTTAGTDRVRTYTYTGAGKLKVATDANGFQRNYYYDAAGRLLQERYDLVQATGSPVTEANFYQYDALGRLTQQTTGVISGGTITYSDRTHMRYNVFGEVTGRGITAFDVTTPTYQETFDYDSGGRMWRSNTTDGATRLYVYDANGNVTLTIQALTADLTGYATISAALTGLNQAKAMGNTATTDVAPTITVYDKRNMAVATREPFRSIDTTTNTYLIMKSKTYNAFGEVTSTTDARGNDTTTDTTDYITYYNYNTMGRLIEKIGPKVDYTLANGTIVVGGTPTDEYYYDLSGRLVGNRDANGNLNRRTLLAHTGYGDDEAKATAEFHAGALDTTNTGIARTRYDIFGQARELENELGQVQVRGYDFEGRLTSLKRPDRAALVIGGVTYDTAKTGLTDYYEYDGLGRRIVHYNSQLTSTYKEKTDYDTQGRVISSIDYAGNTTSYGYVWNATLATTGLGTFGGWTKTTTNTAGLSSTDNLDYFGRTVGRTDFGGHIYAMTFDKGGRQATQTSTVVPYGGQNLEYIYSNTGLLLQINDKTAPPSGWDYSFRQVYGYDLDGNRIMENYKQSWTYSYYDAEVHSIFTEYWEEDLQYAVGTFDALNRVTSVGGNALKYEYDAVGNVRRTVRDDGYAPTVDQDYWYLYDTQNRFIVTKGTFTGTRGSGTISRGTTGLDIGYDAAGQRVSAISDTSSEAYAYTEDGYLRSNHIGGVLRVVDLRDTMGRLTDHREFKENGTTVAYRRTAVYNALSLVTSDNIQTLQTNNEIKVSASTYDYTQQVTSGGVWAGAFLGGQATRVEIDNYHYTSGGSYVNDTDSRSITTYTWWDDARQSQIQYWVSVSGSANTSGFGYDYRGHLAAVDIADGRPRQVRYTTDITGQIIARYEWTGSTNSGNNPSDFYSFFNGVKVGETSNNGPSEQDYALQIAARDDTPSSNQWRYGAKQNYEDYDQSYELINANSEPGGPSAYRAQNGDTLESLAAAMWGDSSLWYLLAEANGLSRGDSIAGGMSLIVPPKVANFHNNASTFRPYDAAKAIGDVQPTTPKPPPKAKGCGVIGQIIMVVIAVVVTVATHGAAGGIMNALLGGFANTAVGGAIATFGTAALSAAAGSIVSQAVGVATGIQEKFSWNAVAFAALSAGVSKSLPVDKLFSFGGPEIFDTIANKMANNVISQGVALATGQQDKFSWTSVALSAVTSTVGDAVSGWADSAWDVSNTGSWGMGVVRDFAIGFAGSVGSAAAKSLIDGSDFGDNVLAALPGVVQNTVGNMLGGRIAWEEKAPKTALTHESLHSGTSGLSEGGGMSSGAGGSGASLPTTYDPAAMPQGSDPIGELVDIQRAARAASVAKGEDGFWYEGYTAKGKAVQLEAPYFENNEWRFRGTLDGSNTDFTYNGLNSTGGYELILGYQSTSTAVDAIVVTGPRRPTLWEQARTNVIDPTIRFLQQGAENAAAVEQFNADFQREQTNRQVAAAKKAVVGFGNAFAEYNLGVESNPDGSMKLPPINGDYSYQKTGAPVTTRGVSISVPGPTEGQDFTASIGLFEQGQTVKVGSNSYDVVLQSIYFDNGNSTDVGGSRSPRPDGGRRFPGDPGRSIVQEASPLRSVGGPIVEKAGPRPKIVMQTTFYTDYEAATGGSADLVVSTRLYGVSRSDKSVGFIVGAQTPGASIETSFRPEPGKPIAVPYKIWATGLMRAQTPGGYGF